MLNPKYMVQLQQALGLIITLDYNYNNLSVTQCIQKGQQLLNQLRNTPQYPCLLSLYLTNSSTTIQKNCNQLKFILLQLIKFIPLHNQTIWWHLLEFYYNCNQRLENMVIDIIIKHFKIQTDQFVYSYLPFLKYTSIFQNGFNKIWKAIGLSKRLIWQIMKQIQNQKYSLQWKLNNINKIVQSLQQLLKYTIKISSNYSQIIIVNILYCFILFHQAVNIHRLIINGDYERFLLQQFIKLQISIKNIPKIPNIVNILIFLSSNTIIPQYNKYNNNQNIQTNQFPIPIQITHKQFQQTLTQLLKSKPNKYTYSQQSLIILTYLLTNKYSNNQFLLQYSPQIFNSYQQYITTIQIKKPYNMILSDIIIDKQQQQMFITNINQVNDYVRYQILENCLLRNKNMFNKQKNNLLMLITFLAFIPNTILQYQQYSQLLTQQILTYLTLILNHPITLTQTQQHQQQQQHQQPTKNKLYLISCIKYLYRYIIDIPHQNLLKIYITILNIRTIYRQIQILCDLLFIKGINILVTCAEVGQLWDFMEIWVINLQNNYMDCNVISYYPILIILEQTQFYVYYYNYNYQNNSNNNNQNNNNNISIGNRHRRSSYFTQNNLCILFQTILQLLIEECCVKKSYQIMYRQQHSCYDNFQVFYKWAEIFVKYIHSRIKNSSNNNKWSRQNTINNINNGNNINGNNKQNIMYLTSQYNNISQLPISIDNNNNNNNIQTAHKNINKVIKKSIGHIFKNQLYSIDTAYIYVYQLKINKDIDGVNQFMINLMTQTFWRGFDVSQVIFYSSVFIGLIMEFKNFVNCQQLYQNFIHIFVNLLQNSGFTNQEEKKIKRQLQEFGLFYNLTLNLESNGMEDMNKFKISIFGQAKNQ